MTAPIQRNPKSRLRSAPLIGLILLPTLFCIALQTQPPTPTSPTQAPSTAASGASVGNATPKINAPEPSYGYPDGQTFIYNVDWRLMNAGTSRVRLDVVNGERHLVASADATGAVALLYHVHDRLETFFNPQTNCALSLVKHTEEGFRRVETSVRYDYSRRKAVLDERNVRAKSQKNEEIDIPSCVTNTLAAVYYVASQPLPTGARLSFPIADGGKPADIQVIVEGREKIKTPAGDYNTVRISAEALNGPQQGKGKVWMWYSDDERRIPVQMRARAFWGTLTFHLTQISSAPLEHVGE